MYKPTTIKDIALALHVSPSTVSRALRDAYQISKETKNSVIEYAAKVNYRSNPIALGLKNKRSYSIGIVVPEITNSFYSQAIAGIESVACDKGYHAIITHTHDSSERELININQLAQRSVDGLIISMSAGTSDYSFLKRLHTDGLPMVFFDRVIDEIDTFKVTSNNFTSVFDAVESLIRSGYDKIAFLGGAPQLSTSRDRLAGYKKALNNYKIPFRPELVKVCCNNSPGNPNVADSIKELLAITAKPDAIFIGDDQFTLDCLRALNKLKTGSSHIAIAGFSNSEVADLLQPPISYIKQNAFEMGRLAVEMLLKLIESRRPVTEFETRLLDTEFMDNIDNNYVSTLKIYRAS